MGENRCQSYYKTAAKDTEISLYGTVYKKLLKLAKSYEEKTLGAYILHPHKLIWLPPTGILDSMNDIGFGF